MKSNDSIRGGLFETLTESENMKFNIVKRPKGKIENLINFLTVRCCIFCAKNNERVVYSTIGYSFTSAM